ncbi:6-aminohexanoate hydrolase [Oceanicola sp. 22II-s10i]|uniref:serine hydrolase domain-containing protein n=1 Tax=Oceanicola sp. 22II-s10i TaxID=1317116 RepID=UPI000B526056|nr:serine hydrolase [Oceanicola sp. 22II-s10i]OWU83874.1 6-aminohexanoate hydrolase [Oceanicola sp. 22II-s10i]
MRHAIPITRRHLLVTSAAFASLGAPLRAQEDRWRAVAEAAEGFSQLHAIAVAQDGETVLESAPRGPGLDRPANVKSVSKSIVALLLGVAIDKGALPGVTATLGDVAPRLIPRGADDRVAALTMEDLVTMRAGLERTSGPNYGGWVASGNWVADALSRDFEAEPGGRMLYSTGSFHVLGAALSEATGESLLSLARSWLGRPLGIDIPPWTRDPQGRYMGGNEMALSPRAMLRIGEMVRQGGEWNGTRVVSQAWLDTSAEPRARSPWSGLGYGYGWFLGGQGRGRYLLARGYGGQVICVMPEAGVTLAITSDPLQPARSDGYFGALQDLIEGPVSEAAA